jgi:hypothetical protein
VRETNGQELDKEYNPGKIDLAAKRAVTARVEYWMDLLGCAGKAETDAER